MKFKTLSILTLAACTLLGGLTSCDDGSSSGETTSSASTSTSTSSSSTNGETRHVTVNFWHTFGHGIEEQMQAFASQFHNIILENENVDVNIEFTYQSGYDDIRNKVIKSFPAGSTPTISVAYPDHIADYLRQGENNVVDLTSYMNSSEYGFDTQDYLGDDVDGHPGTEDFVESFFEEGESYQKDGIYSLAFMKSSEVMFYNVEVYNAAMSIYKPELTGEARDKWIQTCSWDELMELCKVIQEHKDDAGTELYQYASAVEYPAYYDSDSNLFITEIYQNNIPYSSIGEDGKGVIGFEEDEAFGKLEGILNELAGWYNGHLLTTKGVENEYGSTAFTSAQTVFSIGSSGGAGYNIPTTDDFTVGVAMVPYFNDEASRSYISQGPTLTILRNSSYSDEENNLRAEYAWKFLKYITNAENNAIVCINGSEGYVPVRQSAYETALFNQFMENGEDYALTAETVINKIDGNYINTPVFPGSAELRDQGGAVITQVLKGTKNAETALNDAISATKLHLN